jgi:hypothetical protein
MEREGSLPHSKKPTSRPYPKPDESSPCPHHPTSRRYNIKIVHNTQQKYCTARGSNLRWSEIHNVYRVFLPGVKRPGRDAVPSSAGVEYG